MDQGEGKAAGTGRFKIPRDAPQLMVSLTLPPPPTIPLPLSLPLPTLFPTPAPVPTSTPDQVRLLPPAGARPKSRTRVAGLAFCANLLQTNPNPSPSPSPDPNLNSGPNPNPNPNQVRTCYEAPSCTTRRCAARRSWSSCCTQTLTPIPNP